MGESINGKLSIKEVDLSFFTQFPKVAVQLNDVNVTDSLFPLHRHTFFKASRVFARLSIWRLIQKQSPLNGIRIDNGEVYLFTDSTGYTNAYLVKQKKKPGTTNKPSYEETELKSVILKKVTIIIDDRRKAKLHHYLVNNLRLKLKDKDGKELLLTINADILVKNMAFNLPRGSFLKGAVFRGRFELLVNKPAGTMQFDSIDIKLSGQPFNLSGRFELKGVAPQFRLAVHTRKLDFTRGKRLVPDRIVKSLSIVNVEKSLDLDVNINGPLKGGEPLIYLNWGIRDTKLTTPFFDFDKASFTGYFTNQLIDSLPRSDVNSAIHIREFRANWRGLPIVSHNFRITDLVVPVLTCDLVSKFPLTKLNEVMESDFLKLQSGEGAINLTYQGPIIRNNNTNSLVNGTVSVTNGAIQYAPRNVTMKEVTGQVQFKNSDVLVKDLRCVILNNQLVMQGKATNLLSLIKTEPGKAIINWSVATPQLNLDAFTFLLKPARNFGKTTVTKDKLSRAASNIDRVLEEATLKVNLAVDKLRYKKFIASKVNAEVTLLENTYAINNVQMQHAGGSMQLKGNLKNIKENYLQAAVKASFTNVDVSKVLAAFNNFGQDAIMAQNLQGKLTADVDASLGLNEEGMVYPATVESTVHFSLKDGALVNYEPIKRLQNVLFKKRDFDNIRFAELKNRLDISNRDITINRMEIQSSVFSFFIEGVYSLKGDTDLSIQVPLNNLKKRDADYRPENIGTDKKGGRSIFIRGRPGSDGNVNFKLDLFNKYRKDQRDDKE